MNTVMPTNSHIDQLITQLNYARNNPSMAEMLRRQMDVVLNNTSQAQSAKADH